MTACPSLALDATTATSASTPRHAPGIFVTGTDTEVGKSHISAALLYRAAQAGLRAAGYKPVASGMRQVEDRLVNDDVVLLHQHSSIALTEQEVGPCQFQTACAPHVAAQLENRSIAFDALVAGAQQLRQRTDWLVVEGAGGWRIPLNAHQDSADLAAAIGLPVVLVVGLQLGCINHALLSVQAIEAKGLRVAGWVGNSARGTMPLLADTVATLTHWLPGIACLGVVPHLPSPSIAAIAPYLNPEAMAAWPCPRTIA